MTTPSTSISRAALFALIGYIGSGPVAFLLVDLVKSQPIWVSPELFVQNYNVVQDVPYYFGFLLVGGTVAMIAAHWANESNPLKIKFRMLLSLICAVIFSVFVIFNYVCQTTFVRNLATHYRPEFGPAIEFFSMANPMSLCWGIEMWAYALLGLAGWLMAAYYADSNRTIYWLLTANGVMSIAGAFLTIADQGWVMTDAGMASYFIWNLLIVILILLIYRNAAKNTVQ